MNLLFQGKPRNQVLRALLDGSDGFRNAGRGSADVAWANAPEVKPQAMMMAKSVAMMTKLAELVFDLFI